MHTTGPFLVSLLPTSGNACHAPIACFQNDSDSDSGIIITCRFLFFLKKKSSIIKPTTLNTNEQEAIRGMVADPVACVVSMPPKYQHVVSSLGSEE